jgi:hypothetical protein
LKNSSAYIITKPLQYINSRNIPDILDKDLYIIDNFLDCDNFKDSIVKSEFNPWRSIHKFKTKERALIYIIFFKSRYSRIFVDSDFGIVLRFLLYLLNNSSICVFEEGFASYVPQLRPIHGIKNNIFSLFDRLQGGGNWSGGFKYTNLIYLYNPKLFAIKVPECDKPLMSFARDFASNLNQIRELDEYYSEIDYLINTLTNKHVFLYLSGYSINDQFKSISEQYSSYVKLLKPHPNMKFIENGKFDLIIRSNILAEVLVVKLLDVVDKLVLVHEGSFGMLNIPKDDKIVEYIIGEEIFKQYFLDFRQLISDIK